MRGAQTFWKLESQQGPRCMNAERTLFNCILSYNRELSSSLSSANVYRISLIFTSEPYLISLLLPVCNSRKEEKIYIYTRVCVARVYIEEH